MASSSDAGCCKIDPAWKYNYLVDSKNPNSVTCMFCKKVTNGGIHRAKQHQIGGNRNAKKCMSCPENVREELQNYMTEKKLQKQNYDTLPDFEDFEMDNVVEIDDDDGDEVAVVGSSTSAKKRNIGSGKGVGNLSSKKPRQKGPMDSFVHQKPEKVVEGRKKMKQTNIVDACDKKRRETTIQYIARFFYQAGISFNVARLDAFKCAVEAIGQYGPGLKPPSYHELRVPLLKKEVEHTNELLNNHKEAWKKHGCTIMSDGWTDTKNRSLMNFLVNCPVGTMFIKSIDASSFLHTGEKTFELLDSFVEEIGEANIVQVVSDNGSNYVLAGKLLQAKRKHLFWTPCAAHCIDLMLEDIGKLPHVSKALERAITLTGYIYNHTRVLNMMRHFTDRKELVRAGKTRFATSYLTLQRIHKLKSNLRNMFISQEWTTSKWAKEAKGKRVAETVLMPSFWNTVVFILKAMGPLVRVLRHVDGEVKPAMGYIYQAMERAKEAIRIALNENEKKYKDVFRIIDKRWECQLHHPLHAAGHFLNPAHFYDNLDMEYDARVIEGLYSCVSRLVRSKTDQNKIIDELHIYKKGEGLFGIDMAKRTRITKSPAEWWTLYGSSAPTLQQFAIRILSLTCSACGCERNWSVFQQIHTKGRNRLEQQKLNDLVYVKYNQKLHPRYNRRNVIDPICLDDIDDTNEWLVGKMGAYVNEEEEPVFGEDGLTWGDVAIASGVNEPIKYTRRNARTKQIASASRSQLDIEQQEAEAEETEDEEPKGCEFGGELESDEILDEEESDNEEEESDNEEEEDDFF